MKYPRLFNIDKFLTFLEQNTARNAAIEAQVIFENWIKENSQEVEGYCRDNDIEEMAFYKACKNPTHKARIFNIEKVDHDCKHENVTKYFDRFLCDDCGKKMIPTAFKWAGE